MNNLQQNKNIADYCMLTDQERLKQWHSEDAENKRLAEEKRCQPIKEKLLSKEFKEKIKVMAGEAIKSCFVVYDDGKTSQIIALTDQEPYDLFQKTATDTALGLDEFEKLFIDKDVDTGEVKRKTGISMVVYTPDLDSKDATIATEECRVNPSLRDIELLERASEYNPGITEVLVVKEKKDMDIVLSRINPESHYHRPRLDNLGATATKEVVRSMYEGSGVSVKEIHKNGSEIAYGLQVKKAVPKLMQKSAA
ncbi:MAG TPA: hypothetical protein VMR51_00500 [Patescibacteria group bacterium]|nr:hypothetical protein [Patescibacteria group bacterium]